MLSFTFRDKPDIEAYARDIGANGTQVLVDPKRIDALVNEYDALYQSALYILQSYVISSSKGKFHNMRKDDIIDTLVRFCGLDEKDFVSDKEAYKQFLKCNAGFNVKNKFRSVSMVDIIDPLLDSLAVRLKAGYTGYEAENAYLILNAYKEFVSLKTRISLFHKKQGRLSAQDYNGWGKSLKAVPFRYEQRSTGRFYTTDDSIQNWPLELTKVITVDQDYVLFWCDFAQIDFRVGYHIYLREPGSEADKIYLAETDKYRAMYTIICNAAHKQPDYELFAKYRQAYKKAILSAMYNASEQSLIADIKNTELAHELYEFFQHNTRYQNYISAINRMLNFNVDLVVKDYFGFERVLPMPSASSKSDVNSAISACCNTPIQSTSNSIMELWLEALLEKFEEHGYERGKHIIPYLIRHDEAIFKVHKSVLPDLWIFKDCMQVAIDDWDILELEPHAGLYYKEPWDFLEASYADSCLKHADKMTPRKSSATRDEIYRPINEVIEIYTYTMNPLHDIAWSLVNNLPGEISLPADTDTTNYKDWSRELCLSIFEQAAALRPAYKEMFAWYGKFVIYSNKLKKYKCVQGLDAIINLAKALGTDKIQCQTLNSNTSIMLEDIMLKVRMSNSDDTQHILNALAEKNYSTEWVSL